MPWNKNNYPVSLKNLSGKVRDKAIDIANALLEENKSMEESKVIAIATAKAEEWAKNRGIKIKDSEV